MSSGHALGTGNRPATMQSLHATQPALAVQAGPGDPSERDWSQGGRIRHVLSSIPLATLLLITVNCAVWIWELFDDFAVQDAVICYAPVVYEHQCKSSHCCETTVCVSLCV